LNSKPFLRVGVRASMNKHWLARLVIASWAGHIPLIALLVPESLTARGLERTGPIGVVIMIVLAVCALISLVDSAINDMLPDRFTSALMFHRHVGFMAIALALVLTGGAIAMHSRSAAVLPSFLLPALFAVVVTWLDLHARHQGVRLP
jgi:hypothetical protein